MDLQTRLKNLRKSRNLTQPQLAEAVGQTSSSISAYEKGKRIPQADAVIKLANFFNVSTDYLLGVDEEMLSPTGAIVDLLPYQTESYSVLNESLPDYDIITEGCCDGSIEAFAEIEADFCVYVRDDTMAGFGIKDGDIVFVEADTLDYIDSLDLVAIVQDHHAIIRRIITDIPDLLIFESSDKDIEPIIVDLTDDSNTITLIGKVVGIQRSF